MAEAAQELGLQYLGIADHSRSSIQAHGIEEGLLAQVATFAKLNKKFDGFRLFAGVECDILRDGSLDFRMRFCRSWITWSFLFIRCSI